MELKYTPRTVKEIEDVLKRPMVDALGEFSMSNLVLFVRKGLSVDEDTAYTEIEKYLADGKDTMELYFLILEVLQKSGFLPSSVKINEMKERVQKLEV